MARAGGACSGGPSHHYRPLCGTRFMLYKLEQYRLSQGTIAGVLHATGTV
jgi:hypothetical protein